MEKLLAKWIGKKVSITLRSTMPATQQGVLAEVDESAVMLEINEIKSVIPACSILHISLTGN